MGHLWKLSRGKVNPRQRPRPAPRLSDRSPRRPALRTGLASRRRHHLCCSGHGKSLGRRVDLRRCLWTSSPDRVSQERCCGVPRHLLLAMRRAGSPTVRPLSRCPATRRAPRVPRSAHHQDGLGHSRLSQGATPAHAFSCATDNSHRPNRSQRGHRSPGRHDDAPRAHLGELIRPRNAGLSAAAPSNVSTAAIAHRSRSSQVPRIRT